MVKASLNKMSWKCWKSLSLSLCDRLRCGCFPCGGNEDEATVVEDNCCQCNYVALRKMVDVAEVEVIYATFHVDVGETPFFVALDYTKKKVSRVSSLIRMHRTNSFAQEASKKKKREKKRRLDIEQRLDRKLITM